MPFSKLKQEKQVKYMQLIHQRALDVAKELTPPLFDPQGRLSVETRLSIKELRKAGFNNREARRLNKPIVISVDVNADKELARQFYNRTDEALINALSEPELRKKLKKENTPTPEKAIEALKKLPKGSVISLQQEYEYHLRLTSRVYQQSIKEFENGAFDQEIKQALENSLKRTNELVMRHYALAIAQAYKADNTLDLQKLNQELNKARKTLSDSAHRILRDEIRQQTGQTLNKEELLKEEVDNAVAKQKREKPNEEPNADKIRSKLLTELAESKVAYEHDILHIDTTLGTATWIQGSKVTAHERHILEKDDDLATRQIIRHQFKEGIINAFPHSRMQIRVPSLDAKSDESEEAHIKDVKKKVNYINEHYFAKREKKVDFFVYNLYTSLEHALDDEFKENFQTKGARQILHGVHLYNKDAINTGKPLCLVQNIPINGFGSTLGYFARSELVQEATLMTEIALMYSLLGNDNKDVKAITKQYDAYLNNSTGYFVSSENGREAKKIIDTIKNAWKTEKTPEAPQDQILENAKAYLKYIVSHNLHHTDEYSKLTQSLSVFIEEYSIGGCKSANERAQAINGRVLILDSLLIIDPNAPLQDERHALMRALATPKDPQGLKVALDGAYNALGLQSAAALISFMDQGAAAKGLARNQDLKSFFEGGFNGNYFEESSLTNLAQSKASAMQAHKGLAENIIDACNDKHSEILPLPQEEMKKVEDDLHAQCSNYSNDGNAKPEQENFVNERLPTQEAKDHLYKGIDRYENRHFALMVDYCNKFKLTIPIESPDFFRKQFIEFCARKEFKDFGKAGKEATTPEETAKALEHFKAKQAERRTKPESATKSLEELFGKQGAALYKLAVAEERHSKEYMNAVFQESTTHCEGNKWTKRPVIIIAGPSASGKSVAANEAINQADSALPKNIDVAEGNDIVASDGGIAREVSQMRKLVIQVATEHGYSGVSDLYNKSNVLRDVKDCILEAAFASPELGVVIPETFGKMKTSKKLFERIDRLENTTPFWIRVTGESNSLFTTLVDKISTTFREVVSYMGSRRAWKVSKFKDELDPIAQEPTRYDLNISKDNIPESKGYGGFKSFLIGWWGSWKAEQNFKKHFKDSITFTLINDLILLKPGKDPKGPKALQWTQGTQSSDGVIMVSRTTYNEWLKNDSPLALTDYAKHNRKALIYTDGQFALIAAMKLVETEHLRAKSASPLKVLLETIKQNLSDIKSIDCTEKIEALYKAIEDFSTKNPTNSALSKLTEALDKRYHELKLVESLKTGKKLSDEDDKLKSNWEQLQTAQRAIINEQIIKRKPIEALKEALESLQQISSTSTMGTLVNKDAATPIKKDLASIIEECEKNIELLEEQVAALESLRDELKTDFSPPQLRGTLIRSEVMEHMQKIDKQLAEIEQAKTKILLPLQELLTGKQGLSEQLETAATTDELSHRLESTFVIKSVDKQSDGSLQNDYDEDLDEHSHKASSTIRAKEHSSIAALADGNYREHTILDAGSGKELSTVTEVRHPHGLESDKNKEPSVTYTCKESKASNTKEKILEAFALASLMLGNLKTNLGPKNQITLNGSDEEAVKFLFTALMILGDKSTMKFNADAIKVRTLVFDPLPELGRVFRYSSKSCYEEHFKQHKTLINGVVKDFNKLLEDKKLLEQEQETATETLTNTTQNYKNRMDDIRVNEVEAPKLTT